MEESRDEMPEKFQEASFQVCLKNPGRSSRGHAQEEYLKKSGEKLWEEFREIHGRFSGTVLEDNLNLPNTSRWQNLAFVVYVLDRNNNEEVSRGLMVLTESFKDSKVSKVFKEFHGV